MSAIVADTHSLIWYLDPPGNLSNTAHSVMRSAIAGGDLIHISAITIVEIIYLAEKGRIPLSAVAALLSALQDPAFGVTVAPIDLDVALALERVPRERVPDMPDRIITATAIHLGLPLVTRDTAIHSSGVVRALW